MKQTNDLMHYGLNGQPDTTVTIGNDYCQRQNRRYYLTSFTSQILLVLALIMGSGSHAEAEEVQISGTANSWTQTTIPGSAFQGKISDGTILRIYMADAQININSNKTNIFSDLGSGDYIPQGSKYYDNTESCFKFVIQQQYISSIETYGITFTAGSQVSKVTLETSGGGGSSFINSTSPDAKGTGTKEIADDTTHPSWESFSLAELNTNNTGATAFGSLSDIRYIRVYVKEGNNAVDYNSHVNSQTADLLQVTAGTGITVAPAAKAGETADPKDGLNIYNGGTVLSLNDITVTLNAGDNHLKDYKVVVLLSTSDLTNEGNEPTWDFEYTYSFTYPTSTKEIVLTEPTPGAIPMTALTEQSYAINIQSNIRDEFPEKFTDNTDEGANLFMQSWTGKWYITDSNGNKQPLAQGNGANGSWSDGGKSYNGWSLVNNELSCSSTNNTNGWYFTQQVGNLTVYAPNGETLGDYLGYRVVFEVSDENPSTEPKVRFILPIPTGITFEFDGTPAATANISQELSSRTATSVELNWTTEIATTGWKYARFFVVDANGDPVNATGLLTVSDGTACDNAASGFYVYNGGNNITLPTVTLTASPTATLLGYKVKCWLATSTTNIVAEENVVSEEPNITNEYIYSFTKPAPTTADKTGDIAWGSSMQADATAGAPADWNTTWDELSREQRVVWYVTDGTTKQTLALGTAAQANTWVLNLPTDKFSVSAANEAVLTGQTTFTATEWNTWGKPALIAPSGMAYADVHTYQVVCEVYETAAGTVPNVRYTFSFTKDFLGELKSGVTATTVPVVLADANAVSYELTDITLPTGAKYARFYLTDGTGTPVDPTGKLTVSGTPGTVSGHADYGYYIYNESGITTPTVTLTLSDATLNQYRVVMVASADNAVTEGGAVVNEPDWDTQTTWTFKYPVSHTEATGEVEWSPVSMTVPLDIDTHKGSGYLSTLTDYHVVWTVEDGGTAQALTTGTARQAGTWTYSVDGDNATFYAPSDATFADVQGLTFVARLYETATGENDADKSLTYTVSIVRTQFLGTLKDSGTTGSETVILDDVNVTSVNVPLSHATLNGAKYARVWLTQNGTMVDPDGKLSLPTDMTAFGTNHDATYATYGYYLYDENGIALSDVTLVAPGSYSDYQVHVALSVDTPVSYPDFARDIVLRRAPAAAFEPDYDYEYTISFQDSSMKVIKVYAQADDGAQHGNDYNAGSTNNDKEQSFYDLITAAFTELGLQSTYTAANLFVKWNVIDKNGNYITLAQYYADNNQVRLSGFADNTYHASSDNKSVYVYYGQNPPSNASRSQLLNATLTFGNYVFQQGSVVEVWVTNVNSHTAADPADGYLVKLELHFNDDGLSPDDFPGTFSGTATALTHEMGYAETSTQITLSPATTGARYARYYLVKNGEEQAISSTAITLASSNGQTSTERPKRGVYVYNASGLTDDDLKVTVSLPVGTFEDYQLVAVFSDDAPTLNGTTITKEPTALDEKQVYSFVYPIVTIDKYIKWNRNSEQLNIAELLPTDLPSLTNTSTEGYICWSINDGSSNAVSFAGRHNGTPANWSMTLGSDNDNTQQAFSITANLFQWQWNNYTQPTVYAPNSDLFESYPSHTIVCEVSDVSAEKIRVRYVWHFTEDGHANDPFINRAKAGMVTGTGMEEVSRSDANGTFTLQEARTGTSFSETTLNGVKYVRVYVTDAEGNKVDYDTQVDGTNPLLTVTYNGTSATPAGNYPYNGLYVYDNGNTLDINNISITVNSGAGHLDQYQVVALLSTDEISATPQEPEWDCRYNYSFYYPAERIRLNLIQESQLGETSVSFSAEDMQARIVDYFSTTMSDFVNSSSSWYVKWYVEDYEGNRQHLEYNNQGAMNGVWTHTQGNNTSQTVDNSYFINNTNTTYDQYYYTPVGGMNFVTPSQTTLYDHRDLRFICEISNSYDGTTAIPRVIYWIPIPDYFAGNLKTTGTKVEETFIVDADATSRTMNELGTQYTAFATATGATATDQVYVRLYVANLDGTIADNQEQYTFGTTLPAGFEYRADAGWVYLGSGLTAADFAAVTVNSTMPLCESGKKLGLVMAKAPFPRLNPEDASEINTAADIINEPQWDYQYLARFDQFLTTYAPLMKEETVTVRPGNADEGRYTIDISAIADLSAGTKGFDAKYMRWYLADSNGNPLTEQYWAAGGGPNGNRWFITDVNPTAGMSHDHNEYNRASDNAKAYGQMWFSDTNEVQFGNLSFKVTTPTFNAGWGATQHYPLENYQVVIFLSDNDDDSALTQTVTTDPGHEGTTTTVLKEPTPDHKITIKFNSFFGDVNSETAHFEQTFRRSTEEWNEDCNAANSREYTIAFDLKNKQVTLTHVGDATQSFSKTMSDEEVAFWTNNFAKENPDNPTVPFDQNFYFRWLLRNKATGETAQIVNGIQSATGGAPLQDVVQYNVYNFMNTTYYQSAGNRAPGSKYFSNYFEDTNKTMNYLLRVTIDGSPTGGDCFNLTDYDLVLLLSYDEKGEGEQATPWGELNQHYCLVQEPETFDLEYVFHFKGDFEADNIDDPTLKTKYKTIIYDPATRSVTPQLLSNYYELAGDMQVERDKLAEKGYARWYLVSKATGEPIPMGGFSNNLYTAAGGEYGYYKYKFNIDDLHLQGDYSHVFDPTITLPEGMSYRDVRVVCVTTTLTEPQDDNENLPVDMPNKEPRLMQVKYIYDLQLEETLANNWPFVHYHGVHYPDYHRSFEDSREFIGPDTPQDLPAEGTAKVTQYVWDYGKNTFYDPADNSYAVNRIYDKTSSHAAITAQTGDSPDYSTRDIRQKTHTMEYHYYLLLEDGQQEVLKLPLQYYDGDTQDPWGHYGSDTEPMGYIRWYDWTTDKNTNCITPTLTTLQGNVGKGQNLLKRLMSNGEDRGWYTVMTDLFPTQEMVGVNFVAPDGFSEMTDEIVIACDISRYMDGLDDSKRYLVHEPTLSTRYIYHILPAKVLAKRMTDAASEYFEPVMQTLTETPVTETLQFSDIENYDKAFHLLEYNGRTVVSLNGTTGNFSLRTTLTELDHYYVEVGSELKPCNNMQWYAYYEYEGLLYRLKVPMVKAYTDWTVTSSAGKYNPGDADYHREKVRLAVFELKDFWGEYERVRNTEEKINLQIQPGQFIHLVGCLGYDDGAGTITEVPTVSTELFFVDAAPQLLGSESFARTDYSMSSMYKKAAELTFDDFFDDPDTRFNKPLTSFDNYAKIPILFADAQYGFCYPRLYGQCATDYQIHNRGGGWTAYGVAPLHGDYTLLKSMNMPGISLSRGDSGGDGVVYDIVNQQTMYALWYKNPPLYDVTHERAEGKNTNETDDYGTFLYVDAADQSRTIGRLEFDAQLCSGAEIYYTAYIADMTDNITTPQVRFRVYTYNTDTGYPVGTIVDGYETQFLAGHTTSQTLPVISFVTGDIATMGATEKGHWYQVYGYCNLPSENHVFLEGDSRHFYVEVDNFCENTNGADYAVDEITFYTSSARVKIAQISDVCDDEKGVKIRISALASSLMPHFGLGQDREIFYRIYPYSSDPEKTNLEADEAITGQNVYCHEHATDDGDRGNLYGAVPFHVGYDDGVETNYDNTLYASLEALLEAKKDLSEYQPKYGFYKDGDEVYYLLDERYFELTPGQEYFVSLYTLGSYKPGGLEGWGNPYGNHTCTAYSNNIMPRTMFIELTDDSEVSEGLVDMGCGRTTATKDFGVRMRYPLESGSYQTYADLPFDFFMGTKTDINEAYLKDEHGDPVMENYTDDNGQPQQRKIRLKDALAHFRGLKVGDNYKYPDLYTTVPTDYENEDEHEGRYYQILKEYVEDKKLLRLEATSTFTNTYTLEAGTTEVVDVAYLALPLYPQIDEDKEICSPITMVFHLDPTGGAPLMELGFDDVKYPESYKKRGVRLGLEQIAKMRYDGYMLHIPISNYHDKKKKEDPNALYFEDAVLKLSATNDPQYLDAEGNITQDASQLIVTTIVEPGKEGSSNDEDDGTGIFVSNKRMYLPLSFAQNSDHPENYVNFKEGYWYEVSTRYFDRDADAQDYEPNVFCYADLFIVFKVVPEFATWDAQPIGETHLYNVSWHNDLNWKRSTRDQLYKDAVDGRTQNTNTAAHPNGYDNDGERTLSVLNGDLYNANPNPGFVPMKFTYVTLLTGNHAPSLINEARTTVGAVQTGGYLIDKNATELMTDTSPMDNKESSKATDDIRYDMLVRYGSHDQGGEGCFGHRSKTKTGGVWGWRNDKRTDMTAYNEAHKAFDVEKFYGNICKEIYFKPGAELLRQQRLTYEKAWVEKELVANRWYLAASPLKSTYAGDMYVPTKMTNVATNEENVPGQQLTEAFQPISFSTTATTVTDGTATSTPAYSRTKYPIYQRSWSTDGSKVYTKTNDARATDYSANLGYTTVSEQFLEWSHTYNHVQVPYSTATTYSGTDMSKASVPMGFSIRANRKVQKDGSDNDVPALIRLPKADATYQYYDWSDAGSNPAGGEQTVSKPDVTLTNSINGSTWNYTEPMQYRFVTDDASKAQSTQGAMEFNISDLQVQDDYVLVGNPHVASLNMGEFFNGNPSLSLNSGNPSADGTANYSYWTYEGNVAKAFLVDKTTETHVVSTADGDTSVQDITYAITSDGNPEVGIIRPMQAFFVKKGTADKIYFTRDMTIDGNYPTAASSGDGNGGGSTSGGARFFGLTLRAAGNAGGSSATVRLRDVASSDYREGEDVETLFDSNLAGVPMVYTVAGGQAVSIDQRPQLDVVSFGVTCAASDKMAEVSFSGTDAANGNLYVVDAVTGSVTEVGEGSTFMVQPNDYGRYFLTTNGNTTVINGTELYDIVVSVRGKQVTVKSEKPLLNVKILTTGGVMVSEKSHCGTEVSFTVNGGVYIIDAETENDHKTVKLMVK